MVNKEKSRKIVEGIHEIMGEDTSVSVFVKKSIPRQATYTMFYQQVNLELVKLLKPNTCKVLLYLMSKSQYDNYVGVDQQTMQEDLDYKTPKSVVDAIKELKQYNIVLPIKDIQDRRRNVYILNPLQSWKGKVAQRISNISKLNGNQSTQLSLPFMPDQWIPE